MSGHFIISFCDVLSLTVVGRESVTATHSTHLLIFFLSLSSSHPQTNRNS